MARICATETSLSLMSHSNDTPEGPEQPRVLAEADSMSSNAVLVILVSTVSSVHDTFLVSWHVIGTKQAVRGLDLQQKEPKSQWTGARSDNKTTSAFRMDTELKVQRLP